MSTNQIDNLYNHFFGSREFNPTSSKSSCLDREKLFLALSPDQQYAEVKNNVDAQIKKHGCWIASVSIIQAAEQMGNYSKDEIGLMREYERLYCEHEKKALEAHGMTFDK